MAWVINRILGQIPAVKSLGIVPRFDDIVLTGIWLNWQTISDQIDYDIRAS
jgi:hypothetical protein